MSGEEAKGRGADAGAVLDGERRWAVVEGDCVEAMRALPDESVDAVICDPPYNLAFMNKDWDSAGTPAEYQAWCEAWARECLRVLKPGGHLLAFGGTRTYHRLACAVEDAGFEVRDCLAWIYGQGFPKSLNVSKAIDKHLGAERPVVGTALQETGMRGGQMHTGRPRKVEEVDVTASATPEASAWEGWGTALKPAHEPVVVARKPLGKGSVAENVLAHGTGALNVDAARIRTESGGESPAAKRRRSYKEDRSGQYEADRLVDRRTAETYHRERPGESLGRWPANIVLGHADLCVRVGTRKVKGITGTKAGSWRKGHQYSGGWKGAPEEELGEAVGYADAEGNEVVEDWRCVAACPVRALDEQSGVLRSGEMRAGQPRVASRGLGGYGDGFPDTASLSGTYGDEGGASRFFYQAKAAGDERWLWCADCGVAAPRTEEGGRDADCPLHGANPPAPDFGPLFGGGGGACSCPQTVRDEHRGHAVEMHPTAKPEALMRWMVRLATPPGGVVLDPFLGSGTTAVAALRAGLRVVGVERHPPYVSIARARVAAESP